MTFLPYKTIRRTHRGLDGEAGRAPRRDPLTLDSRDPLMLDDLFTLNNRNPLALVDRLRVGWLTDSLFIREGF